MRASYSLIIFSLAILITIYLAISFVTSPDHTLMSRIVGAFFLAIFFLINMRFIDKKLRANLLDKDTYLGSEIISQDLINHLMKGIIGVGGAGYLLSDRFVFHPHKLNFSTKDLIFLLSEIDHVQSCKIMFFVTGLKIVLKSGKIERFVINKDSELYGTMTQQLKTA